MAQPRVRRLTTLPKADLAGGGAICGNHIAGSGLLTQVSAELPVCPSTPRNPGTFIRTMNPVLSDNFSGTVATDVCVIGAGPAGLTFARQCIGSPFDVLVLEGGSYAPDERAQSLQGGVVESDYHSADALAVGRRRQFGGSANIWAQLTRPDRGQVYARALPAEAVDFEDRTWQPAGGWAIGPTELNPYYDRVAKDWIGRPVDNDVNTWSSPDRPPLSLRPGPLTTRMAQYGAASVFLGRYRDDIVAAANVTVQIDSTVVELESDRGGSHVRRARVRRTDGSTFHVAARAFVLAGGTVENVQTLLNSASTQPGGPGNRHDNVGRYLTDHPELLLGTIHPTDPDLVNAIGLYDTYYVDDDVVSGHLTFSQDFKRDERLLNMAAVLLPRPAGFGSSAERAMRSLHTLRLGRLPPQTLMHVHSIVRNPGESISVLRARLGKRLDRAPDYENGYVWHRGGWSRPSIDRSRLPVLEVHAATEQSPERENRIVLTDARDSLGRRRVKLRLRWSAADRENLLRTMRIFAAEIAGSGVGRFQPWLEFTGETRPVNHGLHHPMGGIRMHPDPQFGVVDANCRVHGISNLYVAGSAVFPTGLGYANPTLTLLALSTRLADHVAESLGAVSNALNYRSNA